MQVIGLLNLLMELQAWKTTAPGRVVLPTEQAPRIVNEVLALANGVQELAGAIFDAQPTADLTTVRASVPINYSLY